MSHHIKRSRRNRRVLRAKSAPYSIQDKYLLVFKTLNDPRFLEPFCEALARMFSHDIIQLKKRHE